MPDYVYLERRGEDENPEYRRIPRGEHLIYLEQGDPNNPWLPAANIEAAKAATTPKDA